MFSLFKEFQRLLSNNRLQMENNFLKNTIKKFTFHWITNDDNTNEQIKQIKSNFHIIILDKFEEGNKNYLTFCFDYTLLIILSNDLSCLINFFNNNKNPTFYSLSKEATNIFRSNYASNDHINIIDSDFQEEINILSDNLKLSKSINRFLPFWKNVKRCISGYLITKSYQNTKKNRFDKIKDTIENEPQNVQIKENSYVTLKPIGFGSNSTVQLIYHFEKEELFAIKQFSDLTDNSKYFEREKKNYLKFHHPLIPKYIGSKVNKSKLNLFIEYIDGSPLDKISDLNLTINEKMKIIFELMIIVHYFHQNNYICRDLKPNNFIINKDKTLVIIDFDRLIQNDETITNGEVTIIISELFQPPEVFKGKPFSLEVDIFALGLLIYFIFFEKVPQKTNKSQDYIYNFDEFTGEYSQLKEICIQCTQYEPSKRPKIADLIDTFYINFFSKINKRIQETKTIQLTSKIHSKEFFPYWVYLAENNNPICLYELGLLYENGTLFPQNIEKAIQYFTFASDLNLKEAQFHLGSIYIKGELVPEDKDKAILYYSLAAKQKDHKALYNLALIYINNNEGKKAIPYLEQVIKEYDDMEAKYLLSGFYIEGKYVTQDVQKGYNYCFQLVEQNYAPAQYSLGVYYLEGFHIDKNINKGLKYLHKASNQILSEAQFVLGNYYSAESKLQDNNFIKAIHYFQLAADQNHENSQIILGNIFFDELKNISKAIHYFSHAANDNNNLYAQLKLAFIYYEGKIVDRDIKQAIHYFTLAAVEHNNEEAQFYLGLIYGNGKYIMKDIKKSIYYFTQSANNGSISSQFNLGLYYFEGIYVPHNINKAIQYFTSAAEKGHQEAQYFLGRIYYVYYKNTEKAIRFLTLSADHNHSEAQVLLGYIYYINKNAKQAIHYFTLAAKNSNPYGQYNLGLIYYEGSFVPKDIPKAIYYFNLSSKQNYKEALYALGIIYSEGKYVQRDIAQSLLYYSSAANLNSSDAQYTLGRFYYYGIYVEKNINKALHYLQSSANNNNCFAQNKLGLIYRDGIFVNQDLDKSLYYFQCAANNNCVISFCNLGYFYFKNKFEIKKSIYYYTLAAEHEGNRQIKEAQWLLGMFYFEGRYIEKDIEKAIHYFKILSSNDDQYAKNNLALIYLYGICVQKNISYSIILFQEAVNKKYDCVSMFNLANLILNEKIIGLDKKESISLLIKSSLGNFYEAKSLLCLLIMKYIKIISINNIEMFLKDNGFNNKKLSKELYKIIKQRQLVDSDKYDLEMIFYKNCYYVYDMDLNIIIFDDFLYEKETTERGLKLTNEFYEGFEII